MNIAIIIRWFAGALMVMAFAMLGPILLAVSTDSIVEAQTFGVSATLLFFLGCGLMLSFQQARSNSNDIREVIIVLFLWWFVTPVFAALPFYLNGMSIEDGWFEAVSALTTTGAWISNEAARSSSVQMLWRAEMQALGGLVSIAVAAAIFVRHEFTGIETMMAPFARGEQDSYLRSLRRALRVFLPIYVGLIFIFALILRLSSVPAFDAVIMGLSLISSGGFVPAADGITSYSPSAIGPIFLCVVVGGVNFVLLASLVERRRGWIRQGRDLETPLFLLLIPILGTLYWLTIQTDSLTVLAQQCFNAASLITTNGVLIGQQPALVPALVTAVIGGGALTAAGGIKILRWIITFEQAGNEVWKLTHPHGIPKSQRTRNDLTVWIHFLGFTIILALLVLAITIFGHTLELSATTAVAMISNAGPLIAIAPGEHLDYSIFSPQLRTLLGVGMVFGRIELVVALIFINKHFWRL